MSLFIIDVKCFERLDISFTEGCLGQTYSSRIYLSIGANQSMVERFSSFTILISCITARLNLSMFGRIIDHCLRS